MITDLYQLQTDFNTCKSRAQLYSENHFSELNFD